MTKSSGEPFHDLETSHVNNFISISAQQFFVFNLNANIRAIFIGLLQIIPKQTIFKILEFTQRSSTPQLAYKRNRITMLHGIIWANHELKPGTKYEIMKIQFSI